MASMFASKQQLPGSKAVPNGGLGGLVPSKGVAVDQEIMATTTVPTPAKVTGKRRQKPPPIRTSGGAFSLPTTPSQTSAVSSLGFAGLWTPKTPKDNPWPRSPGKAKSNAVSSPLTGRHNSAAPGDLYCTLPEAPVTFMSKLNSLPVELPGSLLLASQGFPQTNPISPPPSLRLVRRDTEDSTTSSAPPLSTSASSDEVAMDSLRNLTTSTRRNDQSTMQTYIIGNRHVQEARITKPFSAMTIEELLDYLPQCNNPTTITQLWLPAIRTQIQKLAELLEDAADMKVDESLNQIAINQVQESCVISHAVTDLCQDLNDFAQEIRLAATSFRKIVESAESLAERDTKNCHERLIELEDQTQNALKQMESKEKVVEHQGTKIDELKHTIHDIVRVLGTFIQNNVSTWIETIDEPRTQEVLQLISDYAPRGDNKPIRYVRVPEATISQYARAMREAQATVGEYRKVLYGQSATISEQSQNLDAYTSKYEEAVSLVKQRDHELTLLVQQNEDLTKQLRETKATLTQSQLVDVDVEVMGQQYEEQRVNMESLKLAHEMELEHRDAEIADLRRKLGSAREEVFARREDVKNIMSQTQAMLQTTARHPEPTIRSSNASKALRFLGMERDKDKFKNRSLPSSRSVMAFAPPNAGATADSKYSSKELAPTISRPIVQHLGSFDQSLYAQTSPNSPVARRQASSDSNLPSARPRADSLSALQEYRVPASPVDTQKTLPDPPVRPAAHRLSSARIAEITQSIASPTAAQIASDYFKNSILGQTSARRVLSHIPELSGHGLAEAGSQRDGDVDGRRASDESVASSDREMYRRSVCALDMLNSSALPCDETETALGQYMQRGQTSTSPDRHQDEGLDNTEDVEFQTGVARVLDMRPGQNNLRDVRTVRNRRSEVDEQVRQSIVSDGSGYQTSDSEPMTVTQLYHQSGRHIRG